MNCANHNDAAAVAAAQAPTVAITAIDIHVVSLLTRRFESSA